MAGTQSPALAVSRWRRHDDPAAAASDAARRLVAVVSRWRSGSLTLTLSSPARSGLRLVVSPAGAAPASWRDDVRWCVEPLGTPRACAACRADPPGPVVELAPTALGAPPAPLTSGLDWDDERPSLFESEERRKRARRPWPVPRPDGAWPVAAALRENRGLIVRWLLAPATPLERDQLADVLVARWAGPDDGLQHYLGRPVRLRALVSAPAGVSASVLAALALPATDAITLPHLDDAWRGRPDELVGRALPQLAAEALLRLPAAGLSALRGMRCEPPKPLTVLLDPVPPRPATPIRLGAAPAVSGAHQEVALEPLDFTRHVQIIGSTGVGKSALLVAIAVRLLEAGIGVTVLDVDGSTDRAIIDRLSPAAAGRIVFVDHADAAHPVPLNAFRGDPARLEVARQDWIDFKQEQADPHRHGMVGDRFAEEYKRIDTGCAALFGDRHNIIATVLTLGDQDRVRLLARALKEVDPELSRQVTSHLANLRGEQADLFAWAASKFQVLTGSAYLRGILGTGADAIDVADAMDRRRGILVNLGIAELGTGAAQTLGTLWLLKIREAMLRRADPDALHVVLVDEVHLYEHGPLPGMLDQARKFGLGIVVAHQRGGQLSSKLANALGNCGTVVAFRQGPRDAVDAAVRLDGWPATDLAALPTFHAAARVQRDGVATAPFSLEVDSYPRIAPRADAAPARRTVHGNSYRELVAPYEHLRPIDATEIDEVLRAVVESQTPPSAEPAPNPWGFAGARTLGADG